MLCWEAIVEKALKKSHFWRADLMTEQAWSLHPGERTEEFYNTLPTILNHVINNRYPEEQGGHFDLRLKDWKTILDNKIYKILNFSLFALLLLAFSFAVLLLQE